MTPIQLKKTKILNNRNCQKYNSSNTNNQNLLNNPVSIIKMQKTYKKC
jgi:hypothetical protein